MTVDDEVRQLYERYQAAETDEERHEMPSRWESSTDAAMRRFTQHSRTSDSFRTSVAGANTLSPQRLIRASVHSLGGHHSPIRIRYTSLAILARYSRAPIA